MKPLELKELRNHHGLTLRQAAKLCQVAPSTYKNWEYGTARMPDAYSLYFTVRIRTEAQRLAQEKEKEIKS